MAGGHLYDNIDNSEEPVEDELAGVLSEATKLSPDVQKKFGKIDSKYINELVEAKREEKALAEAHSEAKKRFNSIKAIVIEQFKGAGITSQRTTDNVLISLTKSVLYSADSKQRVSFAKKMSREDILSVNVRTFSKCCSELIEQKIDLPEYVKLMELVNLMVRGA